MTNYNNFCVNCYLKVTCNILFKVSFRNVGRAKNKCWWGEENVWYNKVCINKKYNSKCRKIQQNHAVSLINLYIALMIEHYFPVYSFHHLVGKEYCSLADILNNNFIYEFFDRAERHDFDHDFVYSFTLVSSLLKKEGRGNGN